MTLTDKLSHAAERKAFETILDNLIKKGQTQDAAQVATDLVNMVEKLHSDVWSENSFQTLRMIANDPDGKWAHYAQRLIRDNDPYILKTFLTNAVYEGGIRGYHVAQQTAAKYDINVPWLILMDPTSACNMHCTGCWAAEYGHKQSLTFEEMDRVLTEGKELGTHACLFTGGEPLMRKKDMIRLCEKHRDIAFHAFTNGTLIDDEFCKEMLRVGNFFVSVSIEGFEEANDGRRGDGHFQKALAAMDLMRSYRIPFGVSICYTSRNYKVVTSDEFLDLLISKGCVFAWYFHYMPVGQNADTSLLLSLPAAASRAAESTATSTPQAMSSRASLSITRAPTSEIRVFWSACSSRCSSSIARGSRSTKTTCAHVRCSKTRSFCPKWWQNPARIRPTWKRRKARSTCAKSAGHMPSAGSPQQSLSGRRTIRNGCNSYKPPHHFSLPDEKPPLLRQRGFFQLFIS